MRLNWTDSENNLDLILTVKTGNTQQTSYGYLSEAQYQEYLYGHFNLDQLKSTKVLVNLFTWQRNHTGFRAGDVRWTQRFSMSLPFAFALAWTHANVGRAKTCLGRKHRTSVAFMWCHYQTAGEMWFSSQWWSGYTVTVKLLCIYFIL